MKSLRKKFKFLSLLLALVLPSFSLLGDLNNGLVAWYPFDGNASDMSGNGNHGTVNGATLSTDRHGHANKAYSFDGDDVIETASAVISAPPFSITSWVYRMESSSHPNSHLVNFSYGNGLQNNFTFFLKPNTIQIGTPGANDIGNDATFIPYEKWIYVGVTSLSYNQNQTFFYFNGKKIIPDNQQGENNPFPQNSGPTVFGKTKVSDGAIQWHSGKIDDIRIYNRALSAEEVSSVYRLESPNHFAEMNSSVDMEMIWAEPGTFTMGQFGVVGPEHNVTLTKGFYLGKYEVTQAQYEAVMTGNTDGLSATPSQFNGNPNRPVEKVSWNDIQVFLTRLNEQQSENLPNGWAYVLPTEAQWEYACRAGTTTAYSWGDSITTSDANYNSNIGQTADVGQYSANPWGFLDMHGNVREWTADWYASYSMDTQTDPEGPATGSFRARRDGSWGNPGTNLRSANRGYGTSNDRHNHVGFRLGFQQVNQAPTDLNSTAALTIAENELVGTRIGEFNATDPEGGAITYNLVDGENNNSLFNLDSNGTLRTASVLDFESGSVLTLTVEAIDELNDSRVGNFTVLVIDTYEDTDGDGFRDSLEASTGSNLNDPASTPLDQGLVAWYPFDGNASDMSGNGKHGTVNGATLGTDRHGEANRAYSFDGVDDYIDMGDKPEFDGRNTQTISFWVSVGTKGFGSGTDKRPILSKWYSSGSTTLPSRNAFLIDARETSIGFSSSSDSGYAFSYSSNYYLNKWFQATFVFDQGKFESIKMEKLKSKETFENNNVISNSPEKMMVGNWYKEYDSAYKTFHGLIDDIRIYDRALSAEEIQLLYRAESPNHFVDSAKNLEMIWVEPGTFTMGSPISEAGRDTSEVEHNVTLTKGFYLGKYEVTQAQYEAVMTGNTDGLSATPSQNGGNPDKPVEMVSWDDIQVFLSRLNEHQANNLPAGWAYVLPTEAQWEYACRAGTTTAYSWGDNISASDANWNHGNDANQTENVGQYSANPWGFFDMHGNVVELTSDFFDSLSSEATFDPTGPDSGSRYVRKGGSWFPHPKYLRSASRLPTYNSNKTGYTGFRLSLQKVPHVVELNSTVDLEMIWVEPGTFTMGSPESENQRNEDEVEHNVTITQGFYLGQFEVTQAQYEAVMNGNTDGLSAEPSEFSGNPNRPVEKVSYYNVQSFLNRLNETEADNLLDGWAYALPTEAEWEYACRAGTTTIYSWGDSIDASRANYLYDVGETKEVGSYAPNSWGFYDMHGNVWEWVEDWYDEYPGTHVYDPKGEFKGLANRTQRGGAFAWGADKLRSASRSKLSPSNRHSNRGFRLALKKVSFTPLTDDNFRTAIDLWFSDEANATATFGHISNWDVSQVTDFSGIFRERDTFNEDISRWDTSSVTDFSQIFMSARSFDQNISAWDISSAETVRDMFNGAISFDQDISGWDISSEPSMMDMFGAEDGLSIFNKSKIQKSFSVSPRWGYEWEVNDPPHSLSEVEPLVVSTSQPIGTLVGRIRAENAEANESIEYAFVPFFDPVWAKNDDSMKIWLDAADSSYIEQVNGSVIRWNNKAKQQPYLVPQEGGGNPTTGRRKHHGLNVIDFDGSSGLISPDAVDLGGNFSILMVAGIDQVDTNVDTLISSYRGGSPAHFYIRSAQEGVFKTRFQNTGMGDFRNFTLDSEMGPAIYEFIFNLEEEFLYCRINGEEYGKTGYRTAPDPSNYLRVFNKQGDGASRGYIDGFLAELLIFNKALLGGQRTEVENYLGAKWGIDVHIPKPTKNFELRANGEIYTTAVFDHDSEGDYEFQFRAMDEWNQTVEQALTIRVVNAAPDELNASGDLSVYENRPVGSIVSSLTGADPDGDAFEIKLVDSNTTEAGNLFTIDQKGSLRTRVVLDYEIHGQTHPLVVEIVDEYGGKLVKEFAVSILNVVEDFDGDGIEDYYDLDDDNDGFTDEEEIAYGSNPNDRNSVANVAPEVPELFSELSMRENLSIGTYIGNVLAMDWDGDLREVWVVDVNGSVQESSFYIDTNGSLRTARILDFERTPVINFQILAIDEHNATTSQVFTLQIEDVYEPSEPNHLVEGAAGLEMIWVEPGSFLMGSPETEDAKHAIREQQHKVTLTEGYYLGKYEVTQEQYEKVMTGNASGLNAAPSKWKGSGNLPVEKVSVQDVKVFLERLNQSEHIAGRLRNGWAYVLPTEAEWEYACRAGTTSAYNFGDQISRNDANFENDISYPTVSVGQYLPNHWGFYDMHGNVAEWTSSYFGDYPLEAVIDPLGPLSGTNIVSRGGSWKNTADAVRSAVRIIAYTENHRVSHHGFRMVYKPITKAPVSLVSNGKLSILENEPRGTWVGQFSATDPEGEPLTYNLVDGDGSDGNDRFFIDGNGSLRSGVIFDYELGRKTLSIRVQASDIRRASVERIFRVKIEDKSELIPDGRLGAGGWYTSKWYGSYLPFPSGWMYHEILKWVYMQPDGANGYWIWQNVMGWMWTQSDLYPYLWSHEKKEWLYLLRSDEEGILYYKYSDKTIHQFNDKFDIPVSKYPKFSWDHIPRYMHTYKLTDFEQEELEYLAQFPLITIEKAQAIKEGGNNFVQRGTTVAAEGIKALNPDAKVLYYKNIIIDWHGSEATPALEAIENSYLKKANGDFLTIGGRYRKYFDVSMPAVRNWWMEDATRMLNEPSIDGLFIDAHPKVIRDWWMPKRGIPVEKWEEVYAGYLTLLEKINQTFSSQNILLANLIRSDLSEQGGREYLHFFDGSYLEHFANDSLYDGKKADYIALGINHVQQAGREGNIIAFTMKLGEEDGEEDLQSVDEVNLERLNYTTALFLIMAEKYSYFFPYGGTYGADAGLDATWMHTFPIFKKKLGPPKGPAVQEGYIYTREFEHCRVILDIENEKGSLFWEEDSSR